MKDSKQKGTETETTASGKNSAATTTSTNKSPATTTTSKNIDEHPYALGAFIEAWHIEKHEDEWWSSDDDDEDEDDEEKSEEEHEKVIRLAEIIDRKQVNSTTNIWKYYIHYKELNRRMDEWISVSRIVSPPSIGNEKNRVHEAAKKKLQEEQEVAAKLAEASLPLGTRRQRRNTAVTGGTGGGFRNNDPDSTAADSQGDDHTVAAGNKSNHGHHNTNKRAKITTTQVGEHVVATVQAQELDEHEGLDEASLREHEEVTKVKNVDFIELGQHQMGTWYYSPLPKEILGPEGRLDVLYVCEFTFHMFARQSELRRFQQRIPTHGRHPPGNEIYRHGKVAMFEVDGQTERIYCQNLCYIAKLFLDHKTLYYDVDPFLFYVLCEVDDRGYHPVGYYSKEKYSDVGYNLACILTFPAHQRKGYGRFLIAFSYELSKKEEKVGSPEKPMSDLGQQAYKPYWCSEIIDFLLHKSSESTLSIMDISKRTSIMAEDIVFTLNQLGILKMINGVYFIAAEKTLLEGLAKKYPIKEPRVVPEKLHWTPFLTDIKRDKFSIHSKKQTISSSLDTANAAK